MEIARLNELKEVAEDIPTWRARNDIIALIDAEIARQTPDTEIDDAIVWLDCVKRRGEKWLIRQKNKPYEVNLLPTMNDIKSISTAITALQKMKGEQHD